MRPKPRTWLVFVFALAVGMVIGQQLHPRSPLKTSDLNLAAELIAKHWDGTPPTRDYLTEGALRGMADSLHDPYTVFVPEKLVPKIYEKQKVIGIGIRIKKDRERFVVSRVIKDAPAAKAGVQQGDVIREINHQPTDTLNLVEVSAMVRGKDDTEVILNLDRNGTPMELSIRRAEVELPTLEVSFENEILTLKLSEFTETCASELKSALKKHPAKGVILDLQDNPGGTVDEAAKIAGFFLAEKNPILAKEKRKEGESVPVKIRGQQITSAPLAILINGESASAAEMLAGCLQDYKRARIFGTKSFGKNSAQIPWEISGGELRVTFAHWSTPLGQDVGKNKIVPDEETPSPHEAAVEWLKK